jgi:hypothetical protein
MAHLMDVDEIFLGGQAAGRQDGQAEEGSNTLSGSTRGRQILNFDL